MKLKKIKVGKWNALTSFDKEIELHTITLNGEGGAIVVDEVFEEAERKFIEAMNVVESLSERR